MRTIIALCLFAAAAWGCASAATTQPASQPAPAADAAAQPVVSLHLEIGYPPPGVTELKQLIAGFWSDGTVVWTTNTDRTHAGRPYRTAKIDPAEVEKLLKELDAIGVFDDPELTKPRPMPVDAGQRVMAARLGQKQQRISTWREPAAAAGTTQPADRFGQVWTQARKLIEQRVPKEGEPIEKIDQRIFDIARAARK
jgi:hypothetical protein